MSSQTKILPKSPNKIVKPNLHQILQPIPRIELLKVLLNEKVITFDEFKAAEKRLIAKESTLDHVADDKDGFGSIQKDGRVVTILQGHGSSTQPLGELLKRALKLVEENQIDEIHLEEGNYELQKGQGALFTLVVKNKRLKPIVIKAIQSDKLKQSILDQSSFDFITTSLLKGCLKIVKTAIELNSDNQMKVLDETATAVTTATAATAAAVLEYDIVLSNLSITNPGTSGKHESLQHGLLVDGSTGHVRVSVQKCDIYGCKVDHGCGIAVRHGAFCQVTGLTKVRECFTGIKVDSMASIECIDCEIYNHLASGLLITNSVNASAYADLIGLKDIDENEDNVNGGNASSDDSSDDEQTVELTEEEIQTKEQSQQQASGVAPFSIIGGNLLGKVCITEISTCGDSGIFVCDGGRLQLLKGTNVFGNKNRGVVVEDDQTICEIHPMVSVHHNHSGGTYYKQGDGSILRSTRRGKNNTDMEAVYIQEPLQWWFKPSKLFKLLPDATMGMKSAQLKLATYYSNGCTLTYTKKYIDDDMSNQDLSASGGTVRMNDSVTFRGNKKRPNDRDLVTQGTKKVYRSVGDAYRWCNIAASDSSTSDEKEIMKQAKKLLSKLKMMN